MLHVCPAFGRRNGNGLLWEFGSEGTCVRCTLACVGSFSMEFGSKELPLKKWSGQNTENPVPWSLCTLQTRGNGCYEGYVHFFKV